jgi:nitrate/nitrite transporter NarK
MRELGINVEETAVMNAVTPVIAIIMPPLAGMVADRIGNFRVSTFNIMHNFSDIYYVVVVITNNKCVCAS